MPFNPSKLRSTTFNRMENLIARGKRVDAWAATRLSILEVDSTNTMYPVYADRAKGAYIWDADGNRYLDMIMGYGPVVLAHSAPRITDAVFKQLERRTCFSPLWGPRQVELTELLVEVIPGADMAYLLRTGSDATSAAVRLARIYTGRNKIAKWGYNGWHDWTAPRPAGVPKSVLADTLYFEYNDLTSLERLLASQGDQVACVIMMSYGLDEPDAGFLEEVRNTAHRYGVLFILDEMRSGFRISLGGAQEYFGVQADLATFSKAMANGYPISAVVGRADIMSQLGRTHMSSTFFGNAAEMSAALQTINILREEPIIQDLWTLGMQLQDGLRTIIADTGLPATVRGMPVSPFLSFEEDAPDKKLIFYKETLRRGVLFHPNHEWFMSAAHTMADIDMALSVSSLAAQRAMA